MKIVTKASTEQARKEDELYYEGTWWLVANSLSDLLSGRFSIVGEKYPVDFNGKALSSSQTTMMEHKQIWPLLYQFKYGNVSYDYYPRGRVSILANGKAFIYMPKKAFTPAVYDAIRKHHNLLKLDVSLQQSSSGDGSHYDFKLQ